MNSVSQSLNYLGKILNCPFVSSTCKNHFGGYSITYFSKVFDMVKHVLLADKPKSLALNPYIQNW